MNNYTYHYLLKGFASSQLDKDSYHVLVSPKRVLELIENYETVVSELERLQPKDKDMFEFLHAPTLMKPTR